MSVENENLEAHVELCRQRYETLERRLGNIENKVENIHMELSNGNKSMIKVIVGATGTIIAGLLSTVVMLLLNFGPQ